VASEYREHGVADGGQIGVLRVVVRVDRVLGRVLEFGDGLGDRSGQLGDRIRPPDGARKGRGAGSRSRFDRERWVRRVRCVHGVPQVRRKRIAQLCCTHVTSVALESKHRGARIWQEFQGPETGERHGEEGAGNGVRGGVKTAVAGGPAAGVITLFSIRNPSIVGHKNLPCGGLRRRWEEGIAPFQPKSWTDFPKGRHDPQPGELRLPFWNCWAWLPVPPPSPV
jgi:hypothetical protein